MLRVALKRRAKLSLPVRGAWIEMLLFCACTTKVVAPRAGSVD